MSIFVRPILILSFTLLAVFQAWATPLQASQVESLRLRHPDFQVRPRLRPRVNFWKDVFTKYGKHQVVVHHRDFPQVTFGALDFRSEAATLGPIAFDKLKERETKRYIEQIRNCMRSLATGALPKNAFEERIVKEMSTLPGGVLKYKQAVDQDLIRGQTGIREKYADAMTRSGRYLPMIERIFTQEFGLPVELTRLPFIESSFDYKAYSSVGAAGIWQFMPRTARFHGLIVNSVIDERRDPLDASRAAAQYLISAYRELGAWPLAITSYNHGVAGVNRKSRKLGTTDLAAIIEHPTERVFGFASNNFYPEFLAAVEVYDEHKAHFPEVVIERPLEIAQVRLNFAVPVSEIIKQLGISFEQLERTNYALSSAVLKGRSYIPKGYKLKVPKEYTEKLSALKFSGAQAQAVAPPASLVHSGIVYKVRNGDSLSSIAKKYGTSVQNLKMVNDLTSDAVQVGQSLLIKKEGLSKVKQVPAPTTKESSGVAKYTVMSGDSLWTISKKLNISVVRLKQANKIKGSQIKPGQTLIIP